jgi:hypothetical protein
VLRRRLRSAVVPSRAAQCLTFVAVVVLAGCATGPRPSLGEPVNTGGETGQPTGVAAVDRLLAPLEGEVAGPFTATYEITRKLGPVTSTATVVRDHGATSVTVGDVRFISGTGEDTTCTLSTLQCIPGIQEQRISDLSVPSTFWLGSTARLLRVATARSSGAPTGYQTTIAGLAVECVDVPVGTGVEKYCVTPDGPIASFDTAATLVNLTAWSGRADPAALVRPR